MGVRRLSLSVLAAAAALALAACGSSSSSSGPHTSAIAYFPSASPAVAVLDTRPGNPFSSKALAAAKDNPDYALVQAGLFSELAKAGVNYDRDVKPLFGTPIVFGVGAAQVGGGTPVPFLVAWRTASAAALGHLVRDLRGTRQTGRHDGATLYSIDGRAAFAVDGPLLLVSQNAANLSAALDRRQNGDGFTAAEFARDTAGLPHSQFSIAGDPAALLDRPQDARARTVPWVGAIDGYGVSLGNSDQTTARFSFRIDTGGRALSTAQLPIAAGASAPELASGPGLPISFALRDPAQVWNFFRAAQRTADPSGYAKLTRQAQTTRARTGVDVTQFLGSLTGDAQVVSDGTQTVARITTSPAEAASWEKLLAHPSGSPTRSLGDGFYSMADGSSPLTAGAVGDTLLIGRATVAQERAVAALSSTPSHGSGALAVQIQLKDLIARELARSGRTNPLAGQLVDALGTLTGSLQASPKALTGSAAVPYHLTGQTTG